MFNTMESIDALQQEIMAGSWDLVLRKISALRVPDSLLVDIYEQVLAAANWQIVLELLEIGEFSAARMLVRQSRMLHSLQENNPKRYTRLEKFASWTVPIEPQQVAFCH